jgi:hypothetical protein
LKIGRFSAVVLANLNPGVNAGVFLLREPARRTASSDWSIRLLFLELLQHHRRYRDRYFVNAGSCIMPWTN